MDTGTRTQKINEWANAHTTRIIIRFNNEKERILLDRLEKTDNKSKYIKDLIIKDIAKDKK